MKKEEIARHAFSMEGSPTFRNGEDIKSTLPPKEYYGGAVDSTLDSNAGGLRFVPLCVHLSIKTRSAFKSQTAVMG